MGVKIVQINKSQQVYQILKEKIENGIFKTNERLPSIRKLADEYGINKNTVNTVISMLINEGLIESRSGIGTFVSSKCAAPFPIGVMLFDFEKSMSVDAEILSYIQQNLDKRFFLNLYNTSNRADVFCDGVERLVQTGVKGLIITPPKIGTFSPSEFTRLKEAIGNIPVVFVIRALEGLEADFFTVDLSKGIYRAMEYFISQGKTQTALIKHDSQKFVTEELRGLDKAIKDFSLVKNQIRTIDYSDNIKDIESALAEIIGDIDSLICPDGLLFQLQGLINDAGKRIPQELSIVSINNTIYSKMFRPLPTTISYPMERIGKTAIKTLISRIDGTCAQERIVKSYTPDFLVRST